MAVLRTSGLRKFELVTYWLDEVHHIKAALEDKDFCSQQDQIEKLILSLAQPSTAYDVVMSYKGELDIKMKDGKTSIRSIKLAIKPAVALMHYVCASGATLPNLDHVKAYLIDFSGQAAALTGFINFLNKKFDTSIDYLAFKKSKNFNKKRKNKVEKEIIQLMDKPLYNKEDVLNWVKNGLRYFHNVSYVDSLKVKFEMITETDDGYAILLQNHSYWLPKNILDSKR